MAKGGAYIQVEVGFVGVQSRVELSMKLSTHGAKWRIQCG